MNEEEFRIELNQIRYAVLVTEDREKIEFVKQRIISTEEKLLKFVIGDYILFAVELTNMLYISRRKESLQKIVEKAKEAEFNKFKEKLSELLDKADVIATTNVEFAKLLPNNFADIVILTGKGKAYISKKKPILVETDDLKTEDEIEQFLESKYKVVQV